MRIKVKREELIKQIESVREGILKDVEEQIAARRATWEDYFARKDNHDQEMIQWQKDLATWHTRVSKGLKDGTITAVEDRNSGKMFYKDGPERPKAPVVPSKPSGLYANDMEKDLEKYRNVITSYSTREHDSALSVLRMGAESSVSIDQYNYENLISIDQWVRNPYRYHNMR